MTARDIQVDIYSCYRSTAISPSSGSSHGSLPKCGRPQCHSELPLNHCTSVYDHSMGIPVLSTRSRVSRPRISRSGRAVRKYRHLSALPRRMRCSMKTGIMSSVGELTKKRGMGSRTLPHTSKCAAAARNCIAARRACGCPHRLQWRIAKRRAGRRCGWPRFET